MRHGGAENGALPCTYSDFVGHGIRRASVSLALRQCTALGFLEITHRGGRSISEHRNPSRYRLTYINGRHTSAIRTDEWKRTPIKIRRLSALLCLSLDRNGRQNNHGQQRREK
jgi:hypothetical protein